MAFTSIATDLVQGDQPNTLDVFVIDRQTNKVTRAPRPTSASGALGSSSEPAISADGNVVAFTWQAPTPPAATATPTPTPVIIFAVVPQTYVYAWDRRTNRLQPVSASSRGGRLPGANQPSISGHRPVRRLHHVARLHRRQGRQRATTCCGSTARPTRPSSSRPAPRAIPIAGVASQPSISGDGNLVAFTSDGGDTLVQRPTGEGTQVYVRDMAAGRVDEVSVAADGGAPQRPVRRAGDLAGRQVRRVRVRRHQPPPGTGSPRSPRWSTAGSWRRGSTSSSRVQPNGAPSAGGALLAGDHVATGRWWPSRPRRPTSRRRRRAASRRRPPSAGSPTSTSGTSRRGRPCSRP